MTNIEKKINIDSIRTALICEQIPFEYNAKELVIKIKGIDMTDILLAVHDYSGEKITDLIKENAELKDKLNNLASVADVRLGMWRKYEKENAELKKESNNLFLEGAKRVEELEARLTKAKEIISKLIALSRKEWVYADVREEAEAFLEED